MSGGTHALRWLCYVSFDSVCWNCSPRIIKHVCCSACWDVTMLLLTFSIRMIGTGPVDSRAMTVVMYHSIQFAGIASPRIIKHVCCSACWDETMLLLTLQTLQLFHSHDCQEKAFGNPQAKLLRKWSACYNVQCAKQ
jgi:hypothetical protein